MNTLKKSLLFITLFSLFFSCDNNDNSVSRSTNEIEITIDNGTPISYSTNITAKDYQLAPTSGFNCLFKINSNNSNTDTFELIVGQTVDVCPFTMTTPTNITLTGSEISVLNIQGIDIDYSNSGNSIVFNYQLLGNNVGDDIKITFAGTYFDNSNILCS